MLYFCTLPSRFSFTILPKVAGNKIVLHILLSCWKCVEVRGSAFCPSTYIVGSVPLLFLLEYLFFCGFQIILYFSCGLGEIIFILRYIS
jgi:hypothetical protein